MKKTINLGNKLHQAVKVQSAKQGTTIEAYVAKALWAKLGSSIAPTSYAISEGY